MNEANKETLPNDGVELFDLFCWVAGSISTCIMAEPPYGLTPPL